jgi:hypothetical protein
MFIGSQALVIAVLSPGVAVGYSNLRLPFGLVPTEATIGSYRQKHSVRALHRVYSVEATVWIWGIEPFMRLTFDAAIY